MDTKTKAILNEIVHQRNQYMDAVAALSGEVAERDETIAALKTELDALKAALPASETA